MKPTKNKFYCRACERSKMLFETEKKAKNFIRFNSEEIVLKSGHCPNRSYYCTSCNGWHVTSKKIYSSNRLDRAMEDKPHLYEKAPIILIKMSAFAATGIPT